jgi:DNA-binding transcriptional LysR family regulator
MRSAMELHQLRHFCAVVKMGSFTKAAERKSVTQ